MVQRRRRQVVKSSYLSTLPINSTSNPAPGKLLPSSAFASVLRVFQQTVPSLYEYESLQVFTSHYKVFPQITQDFLQFLNEYHQVYPPTFQNKASPSLLQASETPVSHHCLTSVSPVSH